MPSLATCFLHSIGNPSHSNQMRKRNQRYPNWKRSKTVIIWRWYTLSRKHYRHHWKTIKTNEFSKVARYESDIHKSVSLLHTNNKLSEREIKGKTPFTTASKNT